MDCLLNANDINNSSKIDSNINNSNRNENNKKTELFNFAVDTLNHMNVNVNKNIPTNNVKTIYGNKNNHKSNLNENITVLVSNYSNISSPNKKINFNLNTSNNNNINDINQILTDHKMIKNNIEIPLNKGTTQIFKKGVSNFKDTKIFDKSTKYLQNRSNSVSVTEGM